jgi:hypothetical protein
MGFMAMTFAVVGLTGLFASYAAPLPLERAMQREAAFDTALSPNLPAAARETLRQQLGEDAAEVLDGSGGLDQRVAAARQNARRRFAAEEAAVTSRLRLLVLVVTGAGALFGVALLNIVGRSSQV